jgi:hypothetical protein
MPRGLTKQDEVCLYQEGRLFASIPGEIAGELRLRELLPELDDLADRERLAVTNSSIIIGRF